MPDKKALGETEILLSTVVTDLAEGVYTPLAFPVVLCEEEALRDTDLIAEGLLEGDNEVPKTLIRHNVKSKIVDSIVGYAFL